MIVKNAQVYNTKEHKFEAKDVYVEDGLFSPNATGEVVDAKGCYMVPGFIDVHTHGGNNIDMNHISKENFKELSSFFASQGTTSFLASVLTDTEENTLRLMDILSGLVGKNEVGAECVGVHLEGPFISFEYKGAMPEDLLRDPDIDLIRRYQEASKGNVRYLTLAPELNGAIELIKAFKEEFPIAIGHSAAEYDVAMDSIKAGAEACTHTHNAMKLFHMHRPAITGAVLESDVYCEAICDGFHLHPATVRLMLKMKGYDKVVAITDSIMASGLPDGYYYLGKDKVKVIEGDAQLLNGVRAGSTLTTGKALKNIIKMTGAPLEKVLPLLTENPARLIRIFDKKGSIENGKAADFLLLDKDLNIISTYVGGEKRYNGGVGC